MKKCQSKVEVPKKLIKNVTLAMEYINEKNWGRNTKWIVSSINFPDEKWEVRTALDQHMGGRHFANLGIKLMRLITMLKIHIDVTPDAIWGESKDIKAVGNSGSWWVKGGKRKRRRLGGGKKCQDMGKSAVAMHGQMQHAWKMYKKRRNERKRSKGGRARSWRWSARQCWPCLTFTFGTRIAVPNVHFAEAAKIAQDRRKQAPGLQGEHNQGGDPKRTCRSIIV